MEIKGHQVSVENNVDVSGLRFVVSPPHDETGSPLLFQNTHQLELNFVGIHRISTYLYLGNIWFSVKV